MQRVLCTSAAWDVCGLIKPSPASVLLSGTLLEYPCNHEAGLVAMRV